MKEFLAITKALSDENRVRALMALNDGELCLCQIIEVLGLAPATVSKHMSILFDAGLIQRRKDGKWHYYRLARQDAPQMVEQALQWALQALDGEKVIVTDAKTLCCIRDKDRQEVSACYSKN
ncbi:MAG: ArsR/SmtB family transcription factor [Phycisphaeraceae bacterium JB051]